MSSTHTIAMWSGPRNLSTAMMRAFENRSDTQVWDEPLYAYYLAQTHRPDPMARAIMETGITDWASVIERLCTPPLTGLQYHKHITTHVLDHNELDWTCQQRGIRHVFLIREPERVVSSFNKLITDAEANELEQRIGFHQQRRIFNHIQEQAAAQTADPPLVIDSSRFLTDPISQLQRVCEALEIPYELAMTAWPAGARDSDGVWASHWYASVHRSTGFGPAPSSLPVLNSVQATVARRCRGSYEALLQHAI